MSNIGDYAARRGEFSWESAAEELGLPQQPSANIGWLCSDRICEEGRGDRVAMIWENHAREQRTYTFDDLRRRSNAFAALLKDVQAAPGDRVALVMDKIPELYFSFVGVLKMGGIVQPLFSAFGEDSLLTRLQNAQTKVVITTLRHARKIRRVRDQLPELRTLIVVDIPEEKAKEGERAFDLESADLPDHFPVHEVEPTTPSVLHYTSGTTGQPKGALHQHGSIVAQAITAKYVLDLGPEDLYWCTADPGWVTGTSYGIIGPWALGVTQLVFDGGFSAERWYQLVQDHGVTVWYSAPTAIRLMMKEGTELVQKHRFDRLRHMCSVGEPLNPEAVTWSIEAFGMPFHDTYWQTETGAMMICNYPGMPVKPGSMGKPFPGIEATVVDLESFVPHDEVGKVGLIALRPGWPSMIQTYWQNQAKYEEKFRNGWYLTGDRGTIDDDGYFWFVGRDDDVINTGGHLVGPFEIESALLEHDAVAESAVIGAPDPVNMEVPKAFVVLKPGFTWDDDLELSIMNLIRKRLSPLAMPQAIEVVESLPRTRSGKILRRMLKAKEWGQPLGDLSTLEDD
jgi:acetyl-CoA synthetase